MKDILKYAKEVLSEINKTKWGVIFVCLFAFLSYHYREPIATWLMPNNEMKRIEYTINRDVLIYGVLEDLLKEVEGARTYVYTYHNGQNFLSSDPIVNHKQRASMDYEVVANGIREIGLQMQNIPISLFAKQTELILQGKVLGISKEETKDSAAKNLMDQIGSSHAAALPYRDRQGKVVLVVGIDWVLQDDIFFPESRFRKYVQDIGDLFMGYTAEATIWNLRDNVTRGGVATVQPSVNYIIENGLNYHFLAGNKQVRPHFKLQ